jgi:1-acyl-sn-glycerol-3-phosphate acyltransferase
MTPDIRAAIFLGILVFIPMLWAVVRIARSRFDPIQCMMMAVATLIARLYWRAVMPPRVPLPDRGGAVVIANHRSSVDPFFIQVQADRPIHWMVAREYCRIPIVGWLLRRCEVIPTGRSGIDTAATKTAIRLASQGKCVGMLPEGRINTTSQFMLPCRPGAIMVALRARVPVIPCYVAGSPYGDTVWSPFLMRARVHARYGRPIDLSEYYGCEADDEVVRKLLLRCLSEIARLAGQPDFEPQIAGRHWKPAETVEGGTA